MNDLCDDPTPRVTTGRDGTELQDVPTPALLLDLDVLEANIARMQARADELGVRLRPHIKTHKCVEVARLQRAAGGQGITVSTVEEARHFAMAGFEDITWAFPLIPSRIPEVREIADIARIAVTVDSHEAVNALEEAGTMLGVWIEVDCGYGRSGVDPSSDAGPVLARRIADSPRLALRGCLTHAGHAYHGEDPDAIAGIAEHERRTMVEFGVRLREIGIDPGDLSVGSTPGMAHVRSLEGIDEARPGNYALFDYTQVRLGSCKVSDCAATVLSTVVSSAPARGQSVSDAGALVLSKDTGPDRPPHYGRVFESPEGAALSPDARIVSVSQEHATISASFPVGTRLRILPNHSCLTVACFDHFTLVRNQRVVGQWRIWRCRGPASTLPALSRQP